MLKAASSTWFRVYHASNVCKLSLYALKLVACLTYVPHAALLFLGSVTTLHGVHGVAASFSPEYAPLHVQITMYITLYNGPVWNIAHIKP